MRKKWMALLLCVLLVVQIAAVPAQADEAVYFVAAGTELQPLLDQTMPFWSGGYLYIPASIFTGTVRRKLGVTYVYVESENVAILAKDGNRLLKFDLDQNYAADLDDRPYYPGGILKNGTTYVPAYLLADYFDLDYSVMDVKQGHLVWIRQKNFGLTDQQFADAASYTIASYYEKYMKEKQPTSTTPSPNTGIEIAGKRIYLCMTADEDAAWLMDALEQNDAQAAFFCDAAFLSQQGNLLRRMTATGQAVGILVDAAHPDLTVLEQVEKGNCMLEQATCGRTRLVRVENGTEQEIKALQEAGYRCLKEDLDRSGYALQNAAHAASLSNRLTAWRGSAVVWLGGNVGSAGLQAYFREAGESENHFLAWTETA